MNKKKFLLLLLMIMLLVLLSSCATQVDVSDCVDLNNSSGFWAGTFHGMIIPISFWGYVFTETIAIYDINNNGFWYNFGFFGGFFYILKFISFLIKLWQ